MIEATVRYEDKEASNAIWEKIARWNDFTTLWGRFIEVIVAFEMDWLLSGGYGTFPALKPSTLKKRRRSSRPFDTIAHTAWDALVGDGSSHYREVTPMRLVIGTDDTASHWHMRDRVHDWGVVPARPPLTMRPELRDRLVELLEDYVRD